MCSLRCARLPPLPDSVQREYINAILAPDLLPLKGPMNNNLFHDLYGHPNEVPLRETAKKLDITLEGVLEEFKDYAFAKGL